MRPIKTLSLPGYLLPPQHDQFTQLAEHLRTLNGHFLLSINDCPKARTWFGDFHRLEVAFTYTSTRTPRRFAELLFANYPLPSSLRRP